MTTPISDGPFSDGPVTRVPTTDGGSRYGTPIGGDTTIKPPTPDEREPFSNKRKRIVGSDVKHTPSTGLPPTVDEKTSVDDWSYKKVVDTKKYQDDPYYKKWEDDILKKTVPIPPREEKISPRNVMPKLDVTDPPPTFIDKNRKYWVWNECNKRWWTPDMIPNNQMNPHSALPGGIGGQPDPFSPGVGYLPNNAAWASWDAVSGGWIRRTIDKWCLPEDKYGVPPQDDCAKYGINCPDFIPSGKIYTRIDSTDKLPMQQEHVTYGLWSDNVGNLTEFYTCSMATATSSFFRTILNEPCGDCGAEGQFDIAYGHDGGSGSRDLGGYDWLTPTNAVYSQYRLLCHGNDKPWFTIGNRRLHHIYVVNIKRARMLDRLDEGNIELNLAHLSGSLWEAGGNARNSHTGSSVRLAGTNQVLRLVDDSRLKYDEDLVPAALSGSYAELGEDKAKMFTSAGPVYHMVSGSIETGVYNKSNPDVYGLMYPLLGVIVLDADKLDSVAGFLTVTGSDLNGDNNAKLFTAISGAALYTDSSGDVLGFQARKKKTEFFEYFFVRVKNNDYNFTNNKSFLTGSYGEIRSEFLNNPKVYMTEIGFYNERRELLAVGKISQPLLKSYVNEALFTVKLGYN
jgi:hypothetical protein